MVVSRKANDMQHELAMMLFQRIKSAKSVELTDEVILNVDKDEGWLPTLIKKFRQENPNYTELDIKIGLKIIAEQIG